VAHRLSTVRALDRLLVMDHGRVIEEGSHEALIRLKNGLYRRLFERQALELTKGLRPEELLEDGAVPPPVRTEETDESSYAYAK
jgi:ATP-binding cassette subfamily B protein